MLNVPIFNSTKDKLAFECKKIFMWYRLAQNVDRAIETLKSKGVSDQIIAQLQAMTDIPLRGKYIGALMQNPQMPWNELEEKLAALRNPVGAKAIRSNRKPSKPVVTKFA